MVRPNITCPRCRFRHPADRVCEDAKLLADQNRAISRLQDELRNARIDYVSALEREEAVKHEAAVLRQQLYEQAARLTTGAASGQYQRSDAARARGGYAGRSVGHGRKAMNENPWDRWSVLRFWLRWSWKLKDETAILKTPWGDTYLHDETTIECGDFLPELVSEVVSEGYIRQAQLALAHHVSIPPRESLIATLRRKLRAQGWHLGEWRQWSGKGVQAQNLPRVKYCDGCKQPVPCPCDRDFEEAHGYNTERYAK